MKPGSWIGIIVWGIIVVASGLAASDEQAQDVLFLITGGVLTCLVGMIGLIGCIGWVPALHKEQKSRA